jgi:homotetrameric cytidine deaminase
MPSRLLIRPPSFRIHYPASTHDVYRREVAQLEKSGNLGEATRKFRLPDERLAAFFAMETCARISGFPLPYVSRMYSTGSNALASSFMSNSNTNTDRALEDLLSQAQQAALHSYSPYSGFRVGAALHLTNGAIVTGTNVENVSYGLTICAERAALVTAVSQFGPEIRIDAVAVANLNEAASPPCGACRQMLSEFVLPDAPVLFPAADGARTMPFSALLPLAFDMKLK